MTVYLSPENKGGCMDNDGCGSSGLRNVSPPFYPVNIVLSVYYWCYLQVV